MVAPVVGLGEDAVDVLGADCAGLGADGLDQAAEGDVTGAPEESIGRPHDEGEGVLAEDVASEAGLVELVEDEGVHVFGGQALEDHRVGHARADLLVDDHAERVQEQGLAEQHEVVRAREVLQEQSQLAQALGGHEVRVVDDRHLCGAPHKSRYVKRSIM